MPRYDFCCHSCNVIIDDVTLKIDERDEPLSGPCPNCGVVGQLERLVAAPAISDPYHLGRVKPPQVFKDMLKNMKKHHRHSTINA